MTPLMLVLQSCDLKSLDLRLDLDFDNNDSRLDLDLSPVTFFCLPKKQNRVLLNIGWLLKHMITLV